VSNSTRVTPREKTSERASRGDFSKYSGEAYATSPRNRLAGLSSRPTSSQYAAPPPELDGPRAQVHAHVARAEVPVHHTQRPAGLVLQRVRVVQGLGHLAAHVEG